MLIHNFRNPIIELLGNNLSNPGINEVFFRLFVSTSLSIYIKSLENLLILLLRGNVAGTMAARIAASIIVIIFLLEPVACVDEGDEFSNNLFSDLAPLLQLFGEQVAKQFMSQSMGWADNVIFAMAPLGIITAIIGAIRVGGPTWLKAVIGRARENRAAAEVELMSSTSHEVSEVWNGQALVRTTGLPPMRDIIYFPRRRAKDDFGLQTLEEAKSKGYLKADGTIYPFPS